MLCEVEQRDGCSGGAACQSGKGVGVFPPMRHRVQREAAFDHGLGPSLQTCCNSSTLHHRKWPDSLLRLHRQPVRPPARPGRRGLDLVHTADRLRGLPPTRGCPWLSSESVAAFGRMKHGPPCARLQRGIPIARPLFSAVIIAICENSSTAGSTDCPRCLRGASQHQDDPATSGGAEFLQYTPMQITIRGRRA